MKRKLARALVGAQTVLMVAFAWTAAYLGRDEFRLIADRDQARVPDRASVATAPEPGGLPAVRVAESAQRSVGIVVALPTSPAVADGAVPGMASATYAATVADVAPLLELRGRLLAAQADAVAARAASVAAQAEQRRVQALYDDDRNASQRALDEARSAAAAAAARAHAAAGALASSSAVARAAWGGELADALLRPGDADALAPLLSGRSVLLRVVLRSDDAAVPPARLSVRAGGGAAATARRLAAVPGDAALPGRHVLYLAPAAGLAPGMRVGAQAVPGPEAGASAADSVLVPAAAVVWHAGQPGVYVREAGAAAATAGPAEAATAASPSREGDDDEDDHPGRSGPPSAAPGPSSAPADPISTFRRRAVPDARRVDTQWLLPGFDPTARVVVRGAQVLLSEELKSQIGDD